MKTRSKTPRKKQSCLQMLFLIILVLGLLLSACGQPKPGQSPGDKLEVVTTIFPPYDFVRQLGGQMLEVSMLLPPGSESHTYEPTPREVARIASCDLFIYNGGISDSWVERLLDAAEIDRDKTVRMMDFVELLEESHEGILDHDHDHDDEPIPHLHEYDEHIWTSPKNALLIVSGIADRLVQADPDNARVYQDNLQDYKARLQALDQAFQEVVDQGKRREIIVADRFPLIYFTSHYGLDYTAAFPGCAAETDPKPRTVAGIIDRVKAEAIPYIFYIEFSNEKLADLVVEETGAQKLLFHTAHNVAKEDLDKGASYLSIMEANLENLKRGLGQ
ncbi:MAG: zinc ABC transporter substrate-binding protein [Clostridiaceae bacterium]|nr:zinc ABC transporter substrate-binding protein [Clostridiaceae bacterium]